MKELGPKLQSPKVQGLREEAALFTGLLGSSLGLRQAVAIWGRGSRGRARGYLKCLLSWKYVPRWLYMVPEISKNIICSHFPRLGSGGGGYIRGKHGRSLGVRVSLITICVQRQEVGWKWARHSEKWGPRKWGQALQRRAAETPETFEYL